MTARAGCVALLALTGCMHVQPLPVAPGDGPRLLLVHGSPAPDGHVSLAGGTRHRTGPVALYLDSAVWHHPDSRTRTAVPLVDVRRIEMRDPVWSWGLAVTGGAAAGTVIALLRHDPEFVPFFGPLYAVPGIVVGMIVGRHVPIHRDVFVRPEPEAAPQDP